MRVAIKALILVCWSSLIIATALSQSYQFNTRPRGIQLPVQNILQIEQDTLGRMWFSTSRGVVVSDGLHNEELPDSLLRKFAYRISLHKDSDGQVWLYSASGVPILIKNNGEAWQEEDLSPFPREGSLGRNRFFSVDEKSKKQFFLNSGDQLLFWKEGQPKQFLQLESEKYGALMGVEKLDGELVLMFRNGTYAFKDNQLRPINFQGLGLPSPPFSILKHPEQSQFYFLGKDYLAVGNSPNAPSKFLDRNFNSFDFDQAEDFFGIQYRYGALFYHFNSNLKKLVLDREKVFQIDLFELFQTPMLQTFLIDQEGILWIGSSRGLANSTSQLFQNYTSKTAEFLGEEVTAIHEISPGKFLLGFNNGVQYFDSSGTKTLLKDSNLADSPLGRVMNFSKDKWGRIWFSRNQLGVGMYEVNSGRITEFSTPQGVNISSAIASGDSLFLVGSDRVYIADLNRPFNGIFDLDIAPQLLELVGEDGVFFRKGFQLKNGKNLIIRASKLGNKYPVLEKENFLLVEGYDALEMPNGAILLGTENGLKVFQGGYVGFFSFGNRVIEEPVYTILADHDSGIWVGTNRGVYVLKDDKVIHYKESNGLVGDEINRGALIQSHTGQVLIGTNKGLSVYLPEEKFFASGAPRLHLSQLKLGGVDALKGIPVRVSHSQNFLEVQLIPAAFNESRELWIHYRLAENDSTPWQIIKNPESSQLFLGNLPSGQYHFEIKASYDGVDFSPVFSSGKLIVLQPFYLRVWFLAIAVLFLVGLGVLLSRFYQQLKDLGILQNRVEGEQKRKNQVEQQFSRVWNNVQDPMILVTEQGIIATANPAFAKMLHLPLEQIEGKSIFEFLDSSPQDPQHAQILDQVKLSGAYGISFENTIAWKSGALEMEVYSVLLEESPHGKGLVLSVFHDLTSRKKVELQLRDAIRKAEEASRFKTSLLSNMSHEIRTPLTGIIGGTEHVMMSRQEDKELKDQLDIVLQSGERLLSTINSLLDLAKIEANKMEVVFTHTHLNEFFHKILQPFQQQAESKNLRLEVSILCAPKLIPLDRRFMEMILNNLVGNAIKYSHSGLISVRIWMEIDQLLLVIKDQGTGMSEEFQKKMFEPFEQESKGHKRLYEGTGLGLAITKNLVNLLKGTIEIQSQVGVGTEVFLKIPLHIS